MATLPPRGTMAHLLGRYDNWLLDCDGVLWKGGSPIPGAAAAIQALRDAGKRVNFVTNSSTRSRRGYSAKLGSMGIDADPIDIIPAAYAAAQLLRARYPSVSHVHVVGVPGLVEELEEAGLVCHHDTDTREFDLATFETFKPDKRIKAVVVGFDPSLTVS